MWLQAEDVGVGVGAGVGAGAGVGGGRSEARAGAAAEEAEDFEEALTAEERASLLARLDAVLMEEAERDDIEAQWEKLRASEQSEVLALATLFDIEQQQGEVASALVGAEQNGTTPWP